MRPSERGRRRGRLHSQGAGLRRGRALRADEVGLGKTIEAGMLIMEFVLRGMARRTLVIVPAALVGQWQGELRDKFGVEARSSDESLFGSDPERAWAEASGVVVASPPMARSARHAPLVREQKWDLVCCLFSEQIERELREQRFGRAGTAARDPGRTQTVASLASSKC